VREAGTKKRSVVVALVGNPNTGKSTVFNALTGLRQKVSNYPGVTVEKKTGHFDAGGGVTVEIFDLPGTYSLTPRSPDEALASDVLLGRRSDTPPVDRVVCVVDAANLERNLLLVSQIIDRGLPVIVALTMVDRALDRGIRLDARLLREELGVPVIPLVASSGTGVPELRAALAAPAVEAPAARRWRLAEPVSRMVLDLASALQSRSALSADAAHVAALDLLSLPPAELASRTSLEGEILALIRSAHQKCDFLGIDVPSAVVEARYAWIRRVSARCRARTALSGETLSDRFDSALTHRLWGPVIFLAVMALMFQSIFSWATLPMEWIGEAFNWAARGIASTLPRGELRELIVHGGIAGVAAVVTFLPQILLLFLFLGILEESGYMARAAYIMDRVMARFGLHGKSFIPLLSSFACAIPGIMAARTIDNPKDRLTTMLVAPLMSCSARLPVYTLLIGAFIPHRAILGVLSLPALTLFSLYLLGLLTALAVATLFKKSFLKGDAPELLIELPPYRMPSPGSIARQMADRAMVFLKNAGTIILAASIVLWFLASHPRMEGASPSDQLQHSYAGWGGRMVEPVIRPLGFDWKIGIGLLTSLLQREVFVSTMGTMYGLQGGDEAGTGESLASLMRADRDPVTGIPTFTVLTALCIMVYYVLSMQCLSTIAVMRRETNGWKWPLVQISYMTALAYGATFVLYRVGTALGIGG